MRFKRISLLFVPVLFFQIACSFDCSRTLFVPRAQNVNEARRLSVADHQMNVDDVCYAFWAIPEFTRSYRSKQIARSLFGCDSLVFSGSAVENRGCKDILADYFGLPRDFKSTVCFSPKITNFLLDTGCTFNLDWIKEGMRLQFFAPLVHTRWDLCLCEKVQQKGEGISPAGYLSGGNQHIERNKLAPNVQTVFKGGYTFGDMQDPLRFGKICGTQTKTELAELRTKLLWCVRSQETYKLDISFMVSAPTGTRVTSEFLFDPIVGANHHWQLGVGLHGLWEVWSNEQTDEEKKQGQLPDKSCALLADVNFSTLLPTTQKRAFDFKNSRGSRYMLIMNMDAPRDDILQVPSGQSPDHQYTGHLFPAINKTTLCCDVHVPLQLDVLLALSYKRNAWTFDVGYNLWFRMKEHIRNRQKFPNYKFALKGDGHLYGYFTPLVKNLDVNVPLNGTQSNATIYAGQKDASGNYNTNFTNNNVDNPVAAREANTPGALVPLTVADQATLGITPTSVNGSSPAILLKDCDIDVCSAVFPHASSSKLFFSSSYALERRKQWDPYFGFGFEVEFAHTCRALSQFGAWLTFGATY